MLHFFASNLVLGEKKSFKKSKTKEANPKQIKIAVVNNRDRNFGLKKIENGRKKYASVIQINGIMFCFKNRKLDFENIFIEKYFKKFLKTKQKPKIKAYQKKTRMLQKLENEACFNYNSEVNHVMLQRIKLKQKTFKNSFKVKGRIQYFLVQDRWAFGSE